MEEELTWFALGVCFMSAFAADGALLCDQGKRWGVFLLGPCIWVVMIGAHLQSLVKKLCRSRFRALIICPDGMIRWCKSKNAEAIINLDEGYWFVDQKRLEKEGCDQELWPKKYRCLGRVNTRYAPKSVWRKYKPIEKSVIKRAIRINK